jgi:hypothetical protein
MSPSAATAASGAVCVLEADSKIGAWQGARQQPAERERSRLQGAVGLVASRSVAFMPNWRLQRAGQERGGRGGGRGGVADRAASQGLNRPGEVRLRGFSGRWLCVGSSRVNARVSSPAPPSSRRRRPR